LLSLPDPAVPQLVRKHWVVREMVALHHVSSCLVCHPPVLLGTEVVQGVDPFVTTTQQAAVASRGVAAGGHNYARRAGSASIRGASSGPVPALIRGDVTYLRQDFSVTLPGAPAVAPAPPGAGAAPVVIQQGRRFDFVVRRRPLTPAEQRRWEKNGEVRTSYPQRDAVLFALRELTGQDAGNETLAWQERFPRAAEEAKALRLVREVLRANPVQQEFLLIRHRDSEGEAHTLALARLVAELKGPMRERAKTALVERLGKQSAITRQKALDAGEPELCRAAIRACVRAGEKERVPELLALSKGPDSDLGQLAAEAIRELTGKAASEAPGETPEKPALEAGPPEGP
jgi:hypothetical protein